MIPKRSLQRRPAQHAIPDNSFIDNNHNGVDDRMETMQSYQQHATSYQQPVVDEPQPMMVPRRPAPVQYDNVPVNHPVQPLVISDAEIMQRNNMMIRNVMGLRASGNRPNPRFQPEQQNTVMPAPVSMQSVAPERGMPMDRMNAPQVYTEQDGIDSSWNQDEFGQLMDDDMRSMNTIDSDDYGTDTVDNIESQDYQPDNSMQYNENTNDNPVQPMNGYNMKSSVPVDEPLGNLSADELYGTPDNNEPHTNNTQQSIMGKKSNSLLFIIGGGLLAVLAIGATIILM